MEHDSLNYNLPYLVNKEVEITICQKIEEGQQIATSICNVSHLQIFIEEK